MKKKVISVYLIMLFLISISFFLLQALFDWQLYNSTIEELKVVDSLFDFNEIYDNFTYLRNKNYLDSNEIHDKLYDFNLAVSEYNDGYIYSSSYVYLSRVASINESVRSLQSDFNTVKYKKFLDWIDAYSVRMKTNYASRYNSLDKKTMLYIVKNFKLEFGNYYFYIEGTTSYYNISFIVPFDSSCTIYYSEEKLESTSTAYYNNLCYKNNTEVSNKNVLSLRLLNDFSILITDLTRSNTDYKMQIYYQ